MLRQAYNVLRENRTDDVPVQKNTGADIAAAFVGMRGKGGHFHRSSRLTRFAGPQVEGLIVPSKIYGIAAAGRPVIAICNNDGEIARLVEQYQCGGVVEPGNSDALT